MNISAANNLADIANGRARLFTENQHNSMWMGYCILVIVAVFLRDSHIMTWDIDWHNADVKVQLGSTFSWCVIVGGVALIIEDVRNAKRFNRLARTAPNRNESISEFCQFTDNRLNRGLTGIWSRSDCWDCVLSITFNDDELILRLSDRNVNVNRAFLAPDQIEELKSFLARQRQVVPPASFFGWRRKSAGRVTFGELVG